jgi:hypothetical protein
VNTVLAGLALGAIGALLIFIARPRDGQVAPFLARSNVEILYSLVVTFLVGGGIAGVLAGIGSLAGY